MHNQTSAPSCTLKINNIENSTNSSLSQGQSVLNTITFPQNTVTYLWSVNCTNTSRMETRSFTITSTGQSSAGGGTTDPDEEPSGGGGGGGGSTTIPPPTTGTGTGDSDLRIVDAQLYIKIPKSRNIILQSKEKSEIHQNVTFEVCNFNDVRIVHHFRFDDSLKTACMVEEETKAIEAQSCYVNNFDCDTPDNPAAGLLLINREEYKDNVQRIPASSTNIKVNIGSYNWLQLGFAVYGGLFVVILIAIPAIIILILYLSYDLLRKAI